MKRLLHLTLLTLLLADFAVGLAACGKKEPLKPPEGSTYPRRYPPA